MKPWKKLFYISLGCFLFQACQKNIKDDYPEENGCEAFAGKYLMYDVMENNHYELHIKCLPQIANTSEDSDTLIFLNFANRFDSVSQKILPYYIIGYNHSPLMDYEGYRWSFSNVHFPDTSGRKNVLIGDSIYLYFSIHNGPFYIDDSVPYQSITSVHAGTKIH